MTDHLIGFEWFEKFEVRLPFISTNLAMRSLGFEVIAWHMISICNS